MEVKGSNLRRMFSPTYRGGNWLERGRVLGQGLTEATLKVELTYPCIIRLSLGGIPDPRNECKVCSAHQEP